MCLDGEERSDVNPLGKYNCTFNVSDSQSNSWISPAGWNGPDPVVYNSFDNLHAIKLMEETQQANYPLIQGQVFYCYYLWFLLQNNQL